MRDSNTKGVEKEGSDVEATSEPSLPEESSTAASTPTATPTPSEPVEVSPVVEVAPAPAPAPRPATPVAAAEAAAPADAEVPVAESSAPEVAPAAASPAEPKEATEAPKSAAEAMPEPVVADAAAPAATAPALSIPPSSGAGINLFAPFALPSPPVMVPKANKEKEADKEDKMVAARNVENAKVSGMREDSGPGSKRTYLPEQWSPQNPEGKKKYDRSFLMELRSDPQSQKKPDGLPDMEVVLKDGANQKAMQNNFNREFSPAGFIKASGSRGPPPPRRSAQGKPKSGKPPVVHLSLSLKEDVKLHETENAWKPGILAPGKQPDEEEAKHKDLYKKVRGILNKLTPEKFDKLVNQVQALPIDTAEKLKGVIDLVFDKAVDEPNFSVAYAKMCSELRSKEVENSSFRKILITRCQQEFEKDKDAEIKAAESKQRQEKLKEIENETDPEKKKEMQHMVEEEDRKLRMKSVGNIRFIGELYKLGMLTGQIMIRCISELLSKEDEESLECLCKLLSTVGRKVEAELGGEVLNFFFIKMKDLADKKGKGRNVSSRVRFMLQDCIDLKANKWVPRRDDSNPKTMEEIQKESERETLESSIALSQPNTPRKEDRLRGGMGSMDKRGRGGMLSEDGWKQATSRSRPIDVNKLTKGLMQQGPETATLGSPSQFSKWGGGSGGSAARDLKGGLKQPVITTGNPYSALTDNKAAMFNNSDRKTPTGPPFKDPASGSGSRSSSQHRTASEPTSRDGSLARGKLEEEKRNRVPTPSLGEDSPNIEQPSSDATNDGESGPVCKIKRIDDPDELERVVKNLVQEYLSHKNVEEAKLAVMDYFDWTNLVPFTREVLCFMLDRLQGHQLVSQFLGHLIKTNYMQKHHFMSAFSEILDLCPDLIVDIPQLWNHVGALTAYILLTEAVTFKDLAEPLKVLKGSKEAGVLLKIIIQILVKEKGPSWIRDQWARHGVAWGDFLDEKDIADFVKENEFESFSGGAQASVKEMTQTEIQDKLLELLKSEENFDSVQEWIESNVGERTKERTFIRALMTAICKNAITETPTKMTIDNEKLKQDKLLLRYVDNKEELELQCLYAVQALIAQLSFPQGLLIQIFTVLWEDNLISTEAFYAWFASEDPQESEGRGVCRSSLASFHTLLSEVEDDEEHP